MLNYNNASGFEAERLFSQPMSLILGIETATPVCSVALGLDGQVLAERHLSEENRHASHLHVLIQELLAGTGHYLQQLNAVVVSKGPGSYTGLRVGVSAAKGLCYALNIPLLAVDTLESMSHRLKNTQSPEPGLLIPMIDARRMEVYTAAFDLQLNPVIPTQCMVLNENSFRGLLDQQVLHFFGTGSGKWMEAIKHPNGRHVVDFRCGADGLIATAEQLLEDGKTENTAYFEPSYLKDFIGTTTKNKL